MKQALLLVSFGTSVPHARESIDAVEQAMCRTAPDWDFCRAFTSPTIRRILKQRGETVLSLEEALDGLASRGYQTVAVQPTHLLCGIEYDKICRTAAEKRELFNSLLVGEPLLSDTASLRYIAHLLSDRYPAEHHRAVVFMGHGTAHFSNMVYPALQTAFSLIGRPDMLVGTVEGWPELTDIRKRLCERDVHSVTLVPLMLVAGDHAVNDMAGDQPDSWKSRLEQDGIAVHCVRSGLGTLPGIQSLYCDHLKTLLNLE